MLLFLYGEDSYRSRQKLNKIKDKFLKSDSTGMNLAVLDGLADDFDLNNFKKAATTLPFLGSKRLVIVKDILANKKTSLADELADFLEEANNLPEDTVVVFYESQKADQRRKLFKLLKKKAKAEVFEPLRGSKLSQWIKDEINFRGGRTEDQAIERLAAFVGSDLWRLSNEIEKLIAYRKGEEIKAADVSLLVKAQIDTNIFALTDAIGQRDQKQALRLLHEELAQGENALYLLTMIVYQFRNLVRLKGLVERGADPQSVARESRLHPFVVQKTLAQIRNYTSQELKNIYNKLLEADLAFKTTNQKPEMLLDMLVLRLTGR